MKRFTEAGRRAINSRNWYAALNVALTIPDICGSLENPGPGKSRVRYERWCREWVEPKMTGEMSDGDKVFLSAEDCYQLRNSMIHSGSSEIDEGKRQVLHKIEFIEAGLHLQWVERHVHNGIRLPNFLLVRADLFAMAMFEAADEWDLSVQHNASVQAQKAKLLVINPVGTKIGGIRFGSQETERRRKKGQ